MPRLERSPKPVPLAKQVQTALAALEALSTKRDLENLPRFGITASNPLGVSMAKIQKLAKSIGRNHELACALWDTDCYEARLLTAYVAEPARLTPAQMDRWCKDFDNWAVCDTLCFHLFDRVPHAWTQIYKWSNQRPEFVKRTAFALMASSAGHDKHASDDVFLEGLTLIERAANDERNFVKKAVSWALRRIGRRNRALHRACVELSARLAASSDATERWVGRDAYRELTSVPVERGVRAKSEREKTQASAKRAVKSAPKKKTVARARQR
ncbi:MAG TPA: DNA alkylation repair protein [Polyangiaceae bacterium]|nr:DNA alkylation repair protein [Polyangiaceae bacterium]